MNPKVIAALVGKDLAMFRRDRFFVFVSVLGLVAYVLVFWLLPSDVDESVSLGVSLEGAASGGFPASNGVEIITFPGRDALAEAVTDGGQVGAGIAFPRGFLDSVAAGEPTTVEVLVSAQAPAEFEGLLAGMVDQVAIAAAGGTPPVDPATDVIVLGTDRVGDQISFQEQMRPLLAFLILIVETFALATLVATELQERTVTAVLVTPATVTDFLAAKAIIGAGLAFAEVVLLMAAIGGFAGSPAIVVVVLALGAVLVTGFGMLAGTMGKDFLSVLFWSLALMMPLTIPAFGVLFPGSAAPWVKALPTYPLVDVIVRVTTEGAGWVDAAPSLLLLAGWGAVCFAAGAWVLRRRVELL